MIATDKGTWRNPFLGTPPIARMFCCGFIAITLSILTAAAGALLKIGALLFAGTAMVVAIIVMTIYAALVAVIYPIRTVEWLASWRLVGAAYTYFTTNFLNRQFAHFCWMGVAKFMLCTAGFWLLVDMLYFSGLVASLIMNPLLVAINWSALKYFVLHDTHG